MLYHIHYMPACLCGCKTEVRGKWVRGHHARVNNPSKRDDVRKKRSESSKKRIAEGERSFAGWNRGLSKETDSRLAALGKRHSEVYWTEENRLRQGFACEKQWDDGRIHAPSGPQHGQWKGGVSSLQQRSRAGLYSKWSRPIMVRDGFTCQRCKDSAGGNLVVHHDVERFATIMHRIVNQRDVSLMSFEEQGLIVDEIVRYHVDGDVHGITLCRDCHNAVHSIDPDID